MKTYFFYPILFLSLFLGACDEGRIYETAKASGTENGVVSIEAQILHADSWPSSYTVAIAAFEEDNEYALLTKSIGVASSETALHEINLSNIPANASTIEICVVNRLRQRIATFYSIDMNDIDDPSIKIDQPIDANMFDVIQDQVFTTTCANCHGASTFAAAQLYLVEGKSYENLVDKESVVMGHGELRVKSGSKTQSVLYNILTGDISSSWNYDHSSEINDYNTLELIGAWIDNGAIN